MLGSLRLTIQDAMKELHTLGTRITVGMPESIIEPEKRVMLLKQGIEEMLERRDVPKEISLQDSRLSSSTCKV
jgi:hypothetical protein